MKKKLTNKDFTHLHNHTEYSQFDGLNKISEFPLEARKMGFKALAISDHGVMGGSLKFIKECMATKDKKGNPIPYDPIKPIVGIESYFSKDQKAKSNKEQPEGKKGNKHLLLLAKNYEGYKNLCRLSTSSWVDGYYFNARIDLEVLAKHSEGIICSSACLGSIVNNNLLYGKYKEAKKAVIAFKDIFKDDFYLEVMYHGIDAEAHVIPYIIQLSKETNTKIIASNDAHYLRKCDCSSHEVLLAMNTSKCIKDPNGVHFPYGEFYLKGIDEMAKMFGSNPEFLTNTNEIVDKIDADNIYSNLITGGMNLPKIDIPEQFNTPHDYLEHLAWEGLKKLGVHKDQRYIDRLKTELADVKIAKENSNLDFATYFLIVRDYIKYARDNDILVGSGRGSCFASLLLRCIGVTFGPLKEDLDPLNMIWERFLAFGPMKTINESDFF